jgi:tRNA(fMet)-specific endonuclease VapC
MTLPLALLDTDILSAIMRQNPIVVPKAEEYLTYHEQFSFSIITRYEILRGLKAKGAIQQLVALDRFCSANTVLPLTDDIITRAADIYAFLKQQGQPIGDADILIASTAIVNALCVITNNLNHFNRIPNLQIQSWLHK